MRKTLTLLLFILSITLYAQNPGSLREIDKLFESIDPSGPGVAVAIEMDGKLIYNKAFGLANLESNTPITNATIFECGSVSKQFVAASILLLAKEGKLSLSDDVRKYIPELPKYGATITVDMLLAHTSGLKDWGALYALTGWPRGSRLYTQELGYDIIFKQKSLNFPSGTQYSYSNSNYMLLSLIIERLSKLTLDQFSKKYFFEPMGMFHSQWRENHRTIVKGRATAYTMSNEEYLLNMPFENLHGPGGLLTTTADLLKWNSLFIDSSILGEKYSLNRIEPRLTNEGVSIGYAAGLRIDTLGLYKEIAHSGATGGYRSWLAWYPAKKLSVVLLSNYAKMVPKSYGEKIANILLDNPPVKKESPAHRERVRKNVEKIDIEPYLGQYYSEEVETTYLLRRRGNRIELYRKAGDLILLNHVKESTFTSVGGITYQFEKNSRGEVTGFKASLSRANNVPFKKVK